MKPLVRTRGDFISCQRSIGVGRRLPSARLLQVCGVVADVDALSAFSFLRAPAVHSGRLGKRCSRLNWRSCRWCGPTGLARSLVGGAAGGGLYEEPLVKSGDLRRASATVVERVGESEGASDSSAGKTYRYDGDEASTIPVSPSSIKGWESAPPFPLHSVDGSFPIFVMLPLDVVSLEDDGSGKLSAVIRNESTLQSNLHRLRDAGVSGVMVDVWWGITERDGPLRYNFEPYARLFQLIDEAKLKIQAEMSFHAVGLNVGDNCSISLPPWVLQLGEDDPDIFYTDRQGCRNREYISLSCDDLPLFHGRTAIECYRDGFEAFCRRFQDLLGVCITEMTVGLGPAGELRYPSYPLNDNRWHFPGPGEYQCYDRYMLENLAAEAEAAGRPEWGYGGPCDAGNYNTPPNFIRFYQPHANDCYRSPYGNFFLSWYCNNLLKHARRVVEPCLESLDRILLEQATDATQRWRPRPDVNIKLAGVHWWYGTSAHAAELAAGYYNIRDHDGYEPILHMCAELGLTCSFTCLEMRDHEQDGLNHLPQRLLYQFLQKAEEVGVSITGENALQRYDWNAFDQLLHSARGLGPNKYHVDKITFLRMSELMFQNWTTFCHFMMAVHEIPAPMPNHPRGGHRS